MQLSGYSTGSLVLRAATKHKAALMSAEIDLDEAAIGYAITNSAAVNFFHFTSNSPLQRLLSFELGKIITPIIDAIEEISDLVVTCTTQALQQLSGFPTLQEIVRGKLKQNIEKQKKKCILLMTSFIRSRQVYIDPDSVKTVIPDKLGAPLQSPPRKTRGQPLH